MSRVLLYTTRTRHTGESMAKDSEGNIISDPDQACKAFAQHWGNVFSPKNIDVSAARGFLEKYARKMPEDLEWVVLYEVFEKLIKRCIDSATGPDGLPYSAWANAPASFREALYGLYASLLSTDTLPCVGFNYAWLLL